MARAITTIQIALDGAHIRRTSYRFAPGELARAIESVWAEAELCDTCMLYRPARAIVGDLAARTLRCRTCEPSPTPVWRRKRAA